MEGRWIERENGRAKKGREERVKSGRGRKREQRKKISYLAGQRMKRVRARGICRD